MALNSDREHNFPFTKIIAADSGSAVLDEKFKPINIVACSAILTESPFYKPKISIGKLLLIPIDGREAIIEELMLCKELLKREKCDVIHLDMTLGGTKIHMLTADKVELLKISSKAKRSILEILPRLREIAINIKEIYGIEVLAIGKESIPVRIAELSAGAYAILFMSKESIEKEETFKIGLPFQCNFKVSTNGITIYSLLSKEYGLQSFVQDSSGILEKVSISKMNNPYARGFKVAIISPKQE